MRSICPNIAADCGRWAGSAASAVPIAQSCLARSGALSDDLDWAIGTALAADPAQRPQSAAMFGQMLRTAGRAPTT